MQGFSGPGTIGPTPSNTGVYGYAAQTTVAAGVFGHSTNGRGVVGAAGSGIGVLAHAPLRGTALHVDGIVRFSRSGRVTVAAGERLVRRTGVGMNADGLAFAVLQELRDGITVLAAVPDPIDDALTIVLNRPVPSPTVVAWWVLN